MLQNLSERIKLCYERATEAKECAEEMHDPEAKADFLKIEQRWILLARSYQFSETLDDFTRYHASRVSSNQFDPKPQPSGAAAHSRPQQFDPRVRDDETDVAAILANTPFLLARLSSDLRYLFVSAACAQMFGLRPGDFEGKRIADILGEEAFRTILPYVERVLRGEDVEYERNIHYAGVGWRRMLVRYMPDRDSSGSVRGWVASVLDVTDQRKAEARIAADLQAMTILTEMGDLYIRNDLPIEECLQRTIDAAIAIVGADKGNVRIFDPTSSSLVIAAHRGFAEPFLTFFTQGCNSAVMCAVAIRMKSQVIVEDILQSDIFAGQQSQAVLIEAGVRAIVSTPLMSSSGNIMGLISTHYATPYKPGDRDLSLIKVLARQAADYLERKRNEEVEKALFCELNHRCNNLLAVVQAIANRSLGDAHTPAAARDAFIGRLHALARANRRITRSDWRGVEVLEIVETELEPFRTNVMIEGVPVKVHPQAAQNVSLALHELATNAAKYGALSNCDGKVCISWSITRESNPIMRFRWHETGGPRVAAPHRQGFGTTLLKGMFTSIRLNYLEEGLDCEFDLPLYTP